MRQKIFGLFLFLVFFLSNSVYAEDGPKVEMFTPQGTVKDVRQVACRFSEQMVPFGDPRGLIDPFEITCSEKGTSRWADGKNWVYDFSEDLPAGILCEFRLKPDLKTLGEKEIVGQKAFSFSTGGPSIQASVPGDGAESIDEEQVFILTLDAEPVKDSVLQNVTFSVEGLQDHVGIKLIEGKERDEVLKVWYGNPTEIPILLIQSKQRFPAEARVSLIWGKGVASKTGIASEADQGLHFRTRKAFSIEFFCQKENPRAECIPFTPMSLDFSAPIPRSLASKILLRGPNGKIWKSQMGDEEGKTQVKVLFKGPFPENASFRVEIPSGLKDDSGRSPVNADQFPLAVQTDSYPPLAKFSSRFGILESKADPTLPVTLRNLEPQVKARILETDPEPGFVGKVMGKMFKLPPPKGNEIQAWLRKVASASRESSILSQEKGGKEFLIPKPSGTSNLEVVGIPLKNPGLYIVELESAILGSALLDPPKPMFVPTAALVTNLSVHFKWGRESSLIWVTALDTGEPVEKAQVMIRDCQEKILWKGETDSKGIARINQGLPIENDLPQCSYQSDQNDYSQMQALDFLQGGLLVTAQTPEDMAFVHSSWENGIEPWRFQLPEEEYSGPAIAHTIFDRTLLRAGEAVHMKHILRQHTLKGFSLAKIKVPDIISIEHYGSGEKYAFPLKWDATGTSETTWSIPKEAKLGNYQVILLIKADPKQTGKNPLNEIKEWTSGEFRVEEFRVPLLKGTIQPPAIPLINPQEIPLDLNLQYLAGGGASQLPVKLRSEITPKSIPSFEGFDDFVFSNGPVKEGLVRWGEYPGEGEEEGQSAAKERKEIKLPDIDLILDGSGSSRTILTGLPSIEMPKEILSELEFRDPNGEVQTIAARIPLWPAKYLIGIRPESWAASKDTFKFYAAVVDLSGNPVSGADVKVDLFQRNTFTHRKRIVGGLYAYENTEETKKVGPLCAGKTDSLGLLICEARSPVAGEVILQAESSDDLGRKTIAQRDVWITEKENLWFALGDHDRMDLLPEKKRYEPGETAIFQVRMPFREATALISIEREGILESWVEKISGKKPVVEVPVKGSYAPNVFVSVLAVRGRVAEVKPTAMVDLGKPAYKLGIAEINVGWKDHELKVTLSSDRKVYKVRQKAKVKIQVKTMGGKIPPSGTEVAVAAVDEGLLELMPNQSWNILPAMLGRRGYEVNTSTAQSQVIGKRHFGLKALPQGGGGGKQMTRELFDTLLLWKGRQPLDANGEAILEIPLNDSITSFRIVAVATGGVGLFGTGSTAIQSTQDLMILSGLAPLVREEDRFRAGFTLRNTTTRNMEIKVTPKVEGLAKPLKPQDLSLLPGEAKEIVWEVTAPPGIDILRWEVAAQEKGSPEKDRIKVTQKISPVTPIKTYQATLAQIEKDYQLSVESARNALPGRGGVNVTIRPKITSGLSGITDYMKQYPYACMEQKISTAVALRDETKWKNLMSQFPSHLDFDGLVKYFPAQTYGSETLTSYILAIADEAAWLIPPASREKMELGLRKFIEGSINRDPLIPTADLSIRKLSAVEALSRSGKAEADLLSSISIEPNLWPTSAVIDWLNILQKVKNIPHQEARMMEAEQILRSRINFQGSTMRFSNERSDCLWWLMVSSDTNAVRSILSLLPLPGWKEDIPRLVQGTLGRQKRGAWDLTLANAWGVLAMEKFSKAFETAPVSGTTQTALANQSQVVDWSTSPKGKISSFPWPGIKADLTISHRGTGKPWATIQSLAAIPLKEPFSSGYQIKKSILPIQQKTPGRWSRGDVLRVRLEMEAQADQTWVVVNDPIPAGATILGSGLGRDSRLLTKEEERKGWAWPAYEERSFEAFRAYYEYVPKGKWTVEYTIRLNQSGLFQLPATRAEALYFPEMFGEIPNPAVEVHPR